MIPKKEVWQKLGIGLLTLALLLSACAKTGVLTGGPEDKQAPRIDSTRSTPNFQVHFKKQTIELTFDEWVKLTDVFKQVVISPPLQKGKPEVTLRKKTVRFTFPEEEELRPDATYIINFGEAIRDITQGNIAANLRFVFSTGDYIDSLELSGSILDAYTGEPVDGALMMLYDNLADTVVRKDVPFYFSKTDKAGKFKLQNIKADTFKTFALLGKDVNYIYDQRSEKIGFLDSFIVLNDSTQLDLKIRLFQENAPLKLTDKKGGQYGYKPLVYNQKPWEAILDYEEVGQKVVKMMEEDTIKLWYDWPLTQSWKIYLQQDTLFDTLTIDTTGRAAFFRTAKLLEQNAQAKGAGPGQINPFRGIGLVFNHPLTAVDTSKIILLEDSLKTRVFPKWTIDSLDSRKIRLQYPWKATITYQLQLLPGALTDMYGLKSDSLETQYVAKGTDDFGKYIVKLTELDSSLQYVFQLLKNDKVQIERILSGEKNYQMEFEGLPLGKDYSIRLIEDVWPNGRWDTGNYDEKRQPERLIVLPLQELRANFEAEEKVIAKF